jgi:hypothetical protein
MKRKVRIPGDPEVKFLPLIHHGSKKTRRLLFPEKFSIRQLIPAETEKKL